MDLMENAERNAIMDDGTSRISVCSQFSLRPFFRIKSVFFWEFLALEIHWISNTTKIGETRTNQFIEVSGARSRRKHLNINEQVSLIEGKFPNRWTDRSGNPSFEFSSVFNTFLDIIENIGKSMFRLFLEIVCQFLTQQRCFSVHLCCKWAETRRRKLEKEGKTRERKGKAMGPAYSHVLQFPTDLYTYRLRYTARQESFWRPRAEFPQKETQTPVEFVGQPSKERTGRGTNRHEGNLRERHFLSKKLDQIEREPPQDLGNLAR